MQCISGIVSAQLCQYSLGIREQREAERTLVINEYRNIASTVTDIRTSSVTLRARAGIA